MTLYIYIEITGLLQLTIFEISHLVWYFWNGALWLCFSSHSCMAARGGRALCLAFGIAVGPPAAPSEGFMRGGIFHVCLWQTPPALLPWPLSQLWTMPCSAPAAQGDGFWAATTVFSSSSSSSSSSPICLFQLCRSSPRSSAGCWCPGGRQWGLRTVGSAVTPDFSLVLFHVVDVGQHVGRRDKKPWLSQTEMHFSILKLAAAPNLGDFGCWLP